MNIFSPGYAKQDGNGCWFSFVSVSLFLHPYLLIGNNIRKLKNTM